MCAGIRTESLGKSKRRFERWRDSKRNFENKSERDRGRKRKRKRKRKRANEGEMKRKKERGRGRGIQREIWQECETVS